MKKMVVFIAMLVIAAAFGFSSVNTGAATPVDASGGVSLETLANQGLLKLLGRTVVKNGGLDTEFSGTGFETVITASAETTFTLNFTANTTTKFSILVDDCIEMTKMQSSGTSRSISVPISAGQHTVKVVKESQIVTGTSNYVRLDSIKFAGTVDEKAPDRKFYIEVVGDSYACGDGAVGEYVIGNAWSEPKDDAVTSSFGWYLADMMDADLSVVARGGIGLDGSNLQQATGSAIKMPALYKYASYTDQANGTQYNFSDQRTPDAVIIELGSNDTNSAANQAAWVGYAKNLILQVKEVYGDVPVIWEFVGSKSYLFRGLRELAASDAELAAYDNLYFHTNYFNRNGSAALNTQSGGHPDARDQQTFADRLYKFIDTDTFILDEEEPVTEIVYYVSENGNDNNDGLTPETALKTCPAVLNKFTDKSGSPANAVLTLKVSGAVTGSSGQAYMGFDAASRYYRSDGSLLPVVIETYNYDGTNRATVKILSKPTNGGAAQCDIIQPTTFRNVKFWCVKNAVTNNGTTTNYSVNYIHASGNRLVLDNTVFELENGGKMNISASGFIRRTFLESAVTGNGEVLSEVVLLNGRYDSTTGVQSIAAVNSVSLWADGNVAYSAPGMTCKVTVGKGAVTNSILKAVNNTFTPKEAIVECTTGGIIEGVYFGAPHGASTTSRKVINHDVTFILSGGKVNGYFWTLGNNTTVNGDVNFIMTGGEINVPPFSSNNMDGNIIVLGAGLNNGIVNGDVYNEISGGLMYVSARDGLQASVFFSGKNSPRITGTQRNLITAGTFMFVQSSGTSVGTSGIYLGAYNAGVIETELVNEIRGGLFDQTQLGNTYYFGGQALKQAIKKMTCVIGEEDEERRNVGPVFLGSNRGIAFGSGWGQVGVTTYTAAAAPENQACSDALVYSILVLGGQFEGTVYMTPANAEDASKGYWPRTYGSVDVDIRNGDFLGTTYLSSCGHKVFGHVSVMVSGGKFKNVYGTSPSAGVIYDGLEISISGFDDYGALHASASDADRFCVNNEYVFYPIHKGTIKSATPGMSAFVLNIDGGTFLRTVNIGTNGGTVDGDSEIHVTGGYFKTMQGTSLAEGYVTGGYFLNEPDDALLADGYKKAAVSTTGEKPYDPFTYRYLVREKLWVNVQVAGGLSDGNAVQGARFSGGGTYLEDASFDYSANEVQGYRFLGWEKTVASGTSPAASTFSATGKATENMELYAKYEALSEVQSEGYDVTVDAVGATLTVGTSGTPEILTAKKTVKVPMNAVITVEAPEDSFDGWTNGSGKLISRERVLTLEIRTATELRLQKKGDAADPTVVFYTMNYQVLSTKSRSEVTELPAVPYVLGKRNPGSWSKTLEEIQSFEGTLLSVVPQYQNTDDTFVVTVKSVIDPLNGETVPTAWESAGIADVVTGPTPISETVTVEPETVSGYRFEKFVTADGTLLSEKTLQIRLKDDTTLYAVYVPDSAPEKDAEGTVVMVTAKTYGTTLYFEALRNIPETWTLNEQGILFATKDMLGAASATEEEALVQADLKLVVQGTGFVKYTSSGKALNDVTGLTLKNLTAGFTVYARGYAVCTDDAGETVILLSEVAYQTAE